MDKYHMGKLEDIVPAGKIYGKRYRGRQRSKIVSETDTIQNDVHILLNRYY
jgi:hypothetical protein